jgi:UDP-glucose 4-epimerase
MKKDKHILVAGGLGYIGSHTSVELIQAGYQITILDNLSNASSLVIGRINRITGVTPTFVKGDIRSSSVLREIFKDKPIDSVIHFAGLKAVGESESNPIKYYDNNVTGSIILFEEMARAGVKTIVFSSSATVYGDPGVNRYTEDLPLKPVNVYGKTKLMVEDILRDVYKSDSSWKVALLRYFNPVGAHESGFIGEDPVGIPNNLMPFIAQVAVGKRDKLSVFGGDYPTPDGTGLRDFIHVSDLANGHLAALEALSENSGLITTNLGSGRPYSVLELIKTFEKVSGVPIPYEIVSRRSGDLPEYYADPSYAKKMFNWQTKLDLQRMCEDVWRWQKNNPNGYC